MHKLRDILHKREIKPLIEKDYSVTYICPTTGIPVKVMQKGFNLQDAKHRVAVERKPKQILHEQWI